MSILTRDELLDSIRARVGNDTSDETLKFIEDVTDTFNDLQKNEGEDWKQKYEENDKAWREKYRERFFNGKPKDEEEEPPIIEEPHEEKLTYDSLFETEK